MAWPAASSLKGEVDTRGVDGPGVTRMANRRAPPPFGLTAAGGPKIVCVVTYFFLFRLHPLQKVFQVQEVVTHFI